MHRIKLKVTCLSLSLSDGYIITLCYSHLKHAKPMLEAGSDMLVLIDRECGLCTHQWSSVHACVCVGQRLWWAWGTLCFTKHRALDLWGRHTAGDGLAPSLRQRMLLSAWQTRSCSPTNLLLEQEREREIELLGPLIPTPLTFTHSFHTLVPLTVTHLWFT